MPTFTADENNSQQYFDELNKYMEKNVLDDKDNLVDENFIKHGEGKKLDIQLPHVGKCYDVKRCGKLFRIAIFGSEPADPCTWNMNKKREITEEFNKKEDAGFASHMKGTLYTLQLLFGLELNVKNRIVSLGENEVGIFDLCCLSNGCLYRITKGCAAETIEKDKKIMEENCVEHFKKTIETLEPQIVILQGASARYVMNLAYPGLNLKLGLKTAPIETVKYKEKKEAPVLSLFHPSNRQGRMYNYGNNVEAAKKYVGCAVEKLLEAYDNMF